jgi:GNAT superfamily N-acetyltransferase
MRFRPFQEDDFGRTDGWYRYEGGEGLIYPQEFWESNESFRRRVEQFPDGCKACVNDQDEIIGYMFCHPWVKDDVVPLDCRDFKLPDRPDCFYIHDIAVLPQHRRKGIARAFLDMAILLAKRHGFDSIHGVAVLGSETYWAKHGFTVIKEIGYGKGQNGKVIVLPVVV